MILKCTCIDEYQDRKYGKFKRVMNPCAPDNLGKRAYRCTVCSKEQYPAERFNQIEEKTK